MLHSARAIAQNGGDLVAARVGPVQAVAKGKKVIWLPDALVHEYCAVSGVHLTLHNSRIIPPGAVEQQPKKKIFF